MRNAWRLVLKQERVLGEDLRWEYVYDLGGRLVEAKKILPGQGELVWRWAYDANGNRVREERPFGEVVEASYDGQDRLLVYGDISFTYNAHGEVVSKRQGGVEVGYAYDIFGNLRQVVLDSGVVVSYLVDGLGRQVGKQVNGELVQGFLWDGDLRVVAELDGQGNVVSRFVYGRHSNVPEYMVRADGSIWRLITDHLGSVRMVVNAQDGSLGQVMEYDPWGKVVRDTNPGFQPFGFAGGLYDPQSKLVRFGARDYDAQTGRWMAKDPILFWGRNSCLYG